MRKSRFTEEQIIKVLKEHAAGLSAGELCRKYGISDATFYKWRPRYGGREISDARRLKALEDENRRLKKLLAGSMLDASTLKERCSEKISDAQLAETCCDLGCPREGLFAAARLSPGRLAPEDLSLAREDLPALRGRPPPSLRRVLSHTGLPNIDAKLEQLAVDPRRAPERVRDAHWRRSTKWPVAALSSFSPLLLLMRADVSQPRG
jgi:putative transposase